MIPSGDEGARRAEEKGSFVFRLYVVNQGPGSARAIATPTLIKVSPAPVQKIIGDLSEEAKVLLALGLQQGTT